MSHVMPGISDDVLRPQNTATRRSLIQLLFEYLHCVHKTVALSKHFAITSTNLHWVK